MQQTYSYPQQTYTSGTTYTSMPQQTYTSMPVTYTSMPAQQVPSHHSQLSPNCALTGITLYSQLPELRPVGTGIALYSRLSELRPNRKSTCARGGAPFQDPQPSS